MRDQELIVLNRIDIIVHADRHVIVVEKAKKDLVLHHTCLGKKTGIKTYFYTQILLSSDHLSIKQCMFSDAGSVPQQYCLL